MHVHLFSYMFHGSTFIYDSYSRFHTLFIYFSYKILTTGWGNVIPNIGIHVKIKVIAIVADLIETPKLIPCNLMRLMADLFNVL